MKKDEQIVILITVGLILWAIFSWAISPSSSNQDEPYIPDYIGSCN